MRITPITGQETEAVVALWERWGLTRPWNDPRADIALALRCTDADVLVGRVEGALAAAVMVGFDGHRGWVYYLAVHPAGRRNGLGRAMMTAAEGWLRARGAPKLNLMVRDDNPAAAGFYERPDYEVQATTIFAKMARSGLKVTPPSISLTRLYERCMNAGEDIRNGRDARGRR